MKYIEHDQLKLSKLVFGAASISGEGKGYGFGDISETDSIDLLQYAFDSKINVYDTAPIYGYGSSESRIGKAFKDIREKVFICSKAGVDWHPNTRVNMTNDPKIVLKMFDESRSRLNSDYIDLYMIHWPDKNVDIRSSLEPLLKLKDKGYIKYLGLCNTNQEDLDLSDQIEFIQSEFNYFNNGFEDLNTNALRMGWGTFDKGILSGSVTKDRVFDKSDCRSWAPWWKKSNWKDKVDQASVLSENIKPQNLKDYSLNYSFENIEFSIVGMKNKKHIDDACKLL